MLLLGKLEKCKKILNFVINCYKNFNILLIINFEMKNFNIFLINMLLRLEISQKSYCYKKF